MEKLKKLNLKGHLLTAISYLIPIVWCGISDCDWDGIWWNEPRNFGARRIFIF